MSNINTPQREHIEITCRIVKFLQENKMQGEADFLLLIIKEWATAAGFAQGVLEMSRVMKGQE